MGEVKFRTGKRLIPDYMEVLMTGIPIHKMTYDEAVAAMNEKMVTDHLDQAVDRQILRHFAEHRPR